MTDIKTSAKIKAILSDVTKGEPTGQYNVKDLTEEVLRHISDNSIAGQNPTDAEVNDYINIVLMDHNLPWLVRKVLERGKERIIDKVIDKSGLEMQRYFTKEGVHPYEEIKWTKRDSLIQDVSGEVVFEQKDIEVPEVWSQTAVNIVAQKYFTGALNSSERETSIKQMIDRVAKTYAKWGRTAKYFKSDQQAQIFEEELTYLFANQLASPNSPVWFNLGVKDRKPQCSACFINSVEDSMRSILELCVTEGMIFKGGSGSGVNLSTLRSKAEKLSGSNGTSSGVLSFMKGLDSFAGAIKSGGKTRRAAKMVVLNVDHPDIMDFIKCKAIEEKKAFAMIEHGFDGSFNGEAYQSIQFQNANNSVRVTDSFMEALENNEKWETKAVTTGETVDRLEAKEIMEAIADAAWKCGDPGIQYDTTINKWHTCPNSGRINGSNPCSEYMFLDDTACNLASLNLMKFRHEDGSFDTEKFKRAIKVMITAMEISVDFSSYPTPAITRKSYDFRTLGLGYANLGSLIMASGLAYDSQEGRNLAAAITSIMCATAYEQSAEIARVKGTFYFYEKNKKPMLNVMNMHKEEAVRIGKEGISTQMYEESLQAWTSAITAGKKYGYRNAQTTVLAPTGTIGFLMDCDTTGIEPAIVLVAYKFLAGGGMIKLVNNTVNEALEKLEYTAEQIADIVKYIDEKDTIEGAPHIEEKHLSIFDCAFKPANGSRCIEAKGHIRMMAATQPFLCGAISKTVNMPETATQEEIAEIYSYGWKLGLKALAIYRDGCKGVQPVKTSLEEKESTEERATQEVKQEVTPQIYKHPKLPDERVSITHKFTIDQHKGWITVGMYEDGSPGEIFITMAKEGSSMSGMMDSFATAISIALQYGVPMEDLAAKFLHTRFEPAGFTNNPNIRIAKSIVDYVFRWLGEKFLTEEQKQRLGLRLDTQEESLKASDAFAATNQEMQTEATTKNTTMAAQVKTISTHVSLKKEIETESELNKLTATFENSADAPPCSTCSSMTVRNGACYKCTNCGDTTGCS